MDGDRIVLCGRSWITEIVEHWTPGVHANGPDAYSVTFYDPGDPEEWVCSCRIPVDAADLSPGGLSRIFLDARTRSWRDVAGTPWRIWRCAASTPEGRGKGSASGEDVLIFRKGHGRGADVVTRTTAASRPIGALTDGELQGLLTGSA